MTHMFSICAYGDSPYLEECIRSVKNQSVVSRMQICTSTPSEYIKALADKYGIEMKVRDGESNIADDWNFAYDSANADLVTIAHQDDMYESDYVKELLKAKKKYPDMSLFTTSSSTLKNDKVKTYGSVEIVKKLLRSPLRLKLLSNRSFIKKASITLGNAIICPSCTYDKKLCGPSPFDSKYKFVVDWDSLLRLAEKKGRFVCCEKPLIIYRVHDGAETAKLIKDNTREKEESEMFDRLLNKNVSTVVKRLYKKSYDAYK